MAVVYRVHDANRELDLALKQLVRPTDAAKARSVEALFEREFYTLAQLSHPSVVEVFDYGLDGSGAYYTMELLDGGDLSERAPLPYREACASLLDVCSALSLLHSRRLLHRDISPRNVRCTTDGRSKLIDFGAMVPMGRSAQIVGTPAFVAPEVAHQLSLDARTDLFSVGATLYFALTGRIPFAARSFSDLAEAWRHEPVPIVQLAPDVPPALEALVASLLQIDPAQRPRSAFEVMQRLAAIADLGQSEPEDMAQAYLSTPTLVGREVELHRFEQRLRRALAGRGAALALEAAPGLGRSRLLDACVLAAKTLGANVLRLSGSAAGPSTFSSAHRLIEELFVVVPELAGNVARTGGIPFMHAEPGAEPALMPLEEWSAPHQVLQAALAGFVAQISREQPLVIAIDDAERLDEASLALVAALALDAAESRLLIAITLPTPIQPGQQPALDALRAQCDRIVLAPLSRAHVEAMFSTVFSNAPHVPIIADRIHQIAAGSPRESMLLAQHLLDKQLVRYSDGSWTLPTDLTPEDLPANAQEALRERMAGLRPFGRRLAATQALALPSPWSRSDYVALASHTELSVVDEAINELLQLGVVVSDGVAYSLAQQGVRAHLIEMLSAEQFRSYHARLAERSAALPGSGLAVVHHLLHAGTTVRALERANALVEAAADNLDFQVQPGMSPRDTAATFERAFQAAVATGRPPREIHELARHVTGLSVIADDRLHTRYAPAWLAQLEHDSGLADYRASSEPDTKLRLQAALQRAVARYQETPADTRVYRVDEAIKYLGRHVTFSIAIGARTRDSHLVHSLPGILEPFSGLSRVLHVLWQNAISAVEMHFLGQPDRARQRAMAVYEDLASITGNELRYVDSIRSAIANALATLEVALGHPTAARWIEALDVDPKQQVNAMYLRRLLCIQDGDIEGAERHRKQAEVLAVQASTRQMFLPPLRVEVGIQYRAGDLAGLKQAADQVERLAANAPGWLPQRHLARAYYQQLRGDLAAAKQEFESSIEAALAGGVYWCRSSWAAATAGQIAVLVELDQDEAAREIGVRALARCAELQIDAMSQDIARGLAVAEAKLGQLVEAGQRLDSLIQRRRDLTDAHRALDYEARAQVAILAGDGPAAQHFIDLLSAQGHTGRNPTAWKSDQRVVEQARRSGLIAARPVTAFETTVLGQAPQPHVKVASSRLLLELPKTLSAERRAQRALDLMCDALPARSAWLYLAQEAGPKQVAARGEPRQAPDGLVTSYWQSTLTEEGMMTAATDDPDEHALRLADTWASEDGQLNRPILLRCNTASGLVYVGVAVFAVEPAAAPPRAALYELASALAARLLVLGDAAAYRLA
jgi:hypothetical protein